MSKISRVEKMDGRVDIEYDTTMIGEDQTSLRPVVLTLKCTHEGVIFDVSDPATGEIIQTGYQFIDDIIEMTH